MWQVSSQSTTSEGCARHSLGPFRQFSCVGAVERHVMLVPLFLLPVLSHSGPPLRGPRPSGGWLMRAPASLPSHSQLMAAERSQRGGGFRRSPAANVAGTSRACGQSSADESPLAPCRWHLALSACYQDNDKATTAVSNTAHPCPCAVHETNRGDSEVHTGRSNGCHSRCQVHRRPATMAGAAIDASAATHASACLRAGCCGGG